MTAITVLFCQLAEHELIQPKHCKAGLFVFMQYRTRLLRNQEKIHALGGSVKLVCTSECTLQSFTQEVARGRSITSGPISE